MLSKAYLKIAGYLFFLFFCHKIFYTLFLSEKNVPLTFRTLVEVPLQTYFFQSAGGIIVDSCVHDLDVICWMVGETPESVYVCGHAHTDMFTECNDVSTCAIQLKFPGGAIAQIEVSRSADLNYDQRVEVCLLVLTSLIPQH